MIRRKRNKVETIEVIVNRCTKGMAFNPPPEGYFERRKVIAEEVTKDIEEMSNSDFRLKYASWLFDQK